MDSYNEQRHIDLLDSSKRRQLDLETSGGNKRENWNREQLGKMWIFHGSEFKKNNTLPLTTPSQFQFLHAILLLLKFMVALRILKTIGLFIKNKHARFL